MHKGLKSFLIFLTTANDQKKNYDNHNKKLKGRPKTL